MSAAFAAYQVLYCGSGLSNGIVPCAAFLIAAQTWSVACAKAVEIGLRGLVFQAAEPLESLDGDVSVTYTLSQCFIHRLGVVHLTVAYAALLATEAIAATIGILHELLGRDELNTAIHHVVSQHLFWVGMLAYKLQFGGKRSERCLYTITITQPHGSDFL